MAETAHQIAVANAAYRQAEDQVEAYLTKNPTAEVELVMDDKLAYRVRVAAPPVKPVRKSRKPVVEATPVIEAPIP